MKKVLRTLLASVATLALTVTTAFAAPSINSNGAVVGGAVVNGEKVEAKVEFTQIFTNVKEEVKSVIAKVNSGLKISEVLAEVLEKVEIVGTEEIDLTEYSLLTSMQDLVAVDENGNKLKNVTISWEVPNLVQGVGEVKVLHYSTEREVWEVITPNNVDFASKIVTATFEDLSPVGVIYKEVASNEGGSNNGTDDSTNGSTGTTDSNNGSINNDTGSTDESITTNGTVSKDESDLPETGSAISTTQIVVAAVAIIAIGFIILKGRKKTTN